MKIWDIRSQRLIQHYDAHSGDVNQIDFHPNGRYLLSSSTDSTLKIWDLRQGHILYTLYGHEGASNAVSFSPCGDYFSTGGADSVVMVWKSNLDESDQEFIEEFGAKETNLNNDRQAGGVPPVSQRKATTAKKGAGKMSATKRQESPSKSIMKPPASTGAAVDFNNY